MKRLLVFCFALMVMNAFGQIDLPVDSAFENYHSGNYKRAIELYKQKIEAEKKLRYHSAYSELMLSMCYTSLDSIEQAKDVLLRIFSTEKPSTPSYDLSLQESARRDLAEIYFKQKDYRKALYYYGLHDGAWSHAHFVDINQFEVNYYRAISLSKCYEGLQLKDSAVVVLSPYVFSSYRQLGYIFSFSNAPVNVKDSLKHDSVCTRYLILLKQLHSNKNIKEELKKAEASYQYVESIKPTGKDSAYFEKELTCTIKFYGVDIVVGSGGVILTKIELPSKKKYFYNQAEMLQRFKNLPLYKMIANLPDKR